MTNGSVTAQTRQTDLAGQLHGAPDEPFATAQLKLEHSRRRLAKLNSVASDIPSAPAGVDGDLTRQELVDEIDETLFAEAWKLVGAPAKALAEIATKVFYVQEFTQFDEADLESQIVQSLCRDVLALARALSVDKSERD